LLLPPVICVILTYATQPTKHACSRIAAEVTNGSCYIIWIVCKALGKRCVRRCERNAHSAFCFRTGNRGKHGQKTTFKL